MFDGAADSCVDVVAGSSLVAADDLYVVVGSVSSPRERRQSAVSVRPSYMAAPSGKIHRDSSYNLTYRRRPRVCKTGRS